MAAIKLTQTKRISDITILKCGLKGSKRKHKNRALNLKINIDTGWQRLNYRVEICQIGLKYSADVNEYFWNEVQ